MKKNIFYISLLIIIMLSNCQVFLGPDPDDSSMGIFNSIWNDFNESYALFEHKGINWQEKYNIYAPQISSGKPLFDVCFEMLMELNDAHVCINNVFPSNYYWDTSLSSYVLKDEEPFSRDALSNYFDKLIPSFIGSSGFLYGTFSSRPDIGYIYIPDFNETSGVLFGTGDWAKELDNILSFLSNTNAIILDVRNNGGGFHSNLHHIAGRFLSNQADYIKVQSKNGTGQNDFSSSMTFTVKPDGTRYTKPIVLITNKQTTSAAEWFVIALLTQNHVTHIGGITNGAFSARMIRPLINGWFYTISIQKITDMNGNCYEGIGLTPEYIVNNTLSELETGKDNQLEYALDLLIN